MIGTTKLIINPHNTKKGGSVLYGGSLNECKGLFKSDYFECGVFSMNDQNQSTESAYEIVKNILQVSLKKQFFYQIFIQT